MDRRPEVLYCIREEDRTENFYEFRKSLEAFPPIFSEVHVLCKVPIESKFYKSIKNIALDSSIPFILHSMSDKGFDLGTYRDYILTSEANFFILMSASSRPTVKRWDELLIKPLQKGERSLTGSMVSQESLSSTFPLDLVLAAIKKICSKRVFLGIYNANRMVYFLLNCFGFILIPVYFVVHPAYSFKRLFLFPFFPNTHLRSTGMAINREFFLKVIGRQPTHKIDVLLTESGKRGYSRKAQASGKHPLLVTPTAYFDIRSEQASNYFRSERNFIPVVIDRHFVTYKNLDSDLRWYLRTRSWVNSND